MRHRVSHRGLDESGFEEECDGDRPNECPERASQEAGHGKVDTGEGGLVPGIGSGFLEQC